VATVKLLPLTFVMVPLTPRLAPVRGDLGFAGLDASGGVGVAPWGCGRIIMEVAAEQRAHKKYKQA